MNQADIQRFALVYAVIAEIEGMKIANNERLENKEACVYNEEAFQEKAEELRNLAYSHDEQLL